MFKCLTRKSVSNAAAFTTTTITTTTNLDSMSLAVLIMRRLPLKVLCNQRVDAPPPA
jgi:hypothetical protein